METLVTKTQEFIAVLAILTVVILLLAIRLGWQIVTAFFKPPKLHLGARGPAKDLRRCPSGPHQSGVAGGVQSL
jgi:hypothetical protein